MSSSNYSASERGGGIGATGEARAKIVNHIDTYIQNAKWADPERADRVFEKVFEAPERFISPNPDTWQSYHAEASRIYNKIKDDHGLRLASELDDVKRDYDDMADRHLRREVEDQVEEFGPDIVDRARRGEDVPQELRARVDDVLAHHSPDVYDAPIRDARAVEETTDDPTPDGEGAADADVEDDASTDAPTADESTDVPVDDDRRDPSDMPLPELLGRVAAHKVGRVLRSAAGFLALVVSVLAPLLARTTVSAGHYTGRAIGATLRVGVATVCVILRTVAAFVRGFAAELRRDAVEA